MGPISTAHKGVNYQTTRRVGAVHRGHPQCDGCLQRRTRQGVESLIKVQFFSPFTIRARIPDDNRPNTREGFKGCQRSTETVGVTRRTIGTMLRGVVQPRGMKILLSLTSRSPNPKW